MTNNASKHTGVCQSTNKNAYSERVAARKARYIAKAEELNPLPSFETKHPRKKFYLQNFCPLEVFLVMFYSVKAVR